LRAPVRFALRARSPRVDAVLGGHIYPNLPRGKVGVRYGVMTAADDEFMVELQGTGGHGAYPHQCADPIVAAGHLITGNIFFDTARKVYNL
jgi:metal-dependent amidase/aminoacylase/carboxypeptidase family protein